MDYDNKSIPSPIFPHVDYYPASTDIADIRFGGTLTPVQEWTLFWEVFPVFDPYPCTGRGLVSFREASNPWHSEYKSDTLPTELRKRVRAFLLISLKFPRISSVHQVAILRRSGRVDSNHWFRAYEAREMPLLYVAMYFRCQWTLKKPPPLITNRILKLRHEINRAKRGQSFIICFKALQR